MKPVDNISTKKMIKLVNTYHLKLGTIFSCHLGTRPYSMYKRIPNGIVSIRIPSAIWNNRGGAHEFPIAKNCFIEEDITL